MQEEELDSCRPAELRGSSPDGKAFSTWAAYGCYLDNWILPRWGELRLDKVRAVAVEEWLATIKRAKGTKAKMRNIMSAVFTHAMRYEWVDKNPIQLVRQSAKRERTPDVLELHEIQVLLSKLPVRERTLALLDAATGLRVSELLALKWEDVPAFFRHTAQSEGGRCEDGTGALKAREHQDHVGRLHAGDDDQQTRGTEQGCKDDCSESG